MTGMQDGTRKIGLVYTVTEYPNAGGFRVTVWVDGEPLPVTYGPVWTATDAHAVGKQVIETLESVALYRIRHVNANFDIVSRVQ